MLFSRCADKNSAGKRNCLLREQEAFPSHFFHGFEIVSVWCECSFKLQQKQQIGHSFTPVTINSTLSCALKLVKYCSKGKTVSVNCGNLNE